MNGHLYPLKSCKNLLYGHYFTVMEVSTFILSKETHYASIIGCA